MTYSTPQRRSANYKNVSWTIKNEEVLTLLNSYTGPSNHPQGFVRGVLAAEGIIRPKAAQMMPQSSYGVISVPFCLSFYKEDHALLKAKAEECNLTIQQLMEGVLINYIHNKTNDEQQRD